jgi:hypothetical protein
MTTFLDSGNILLKCGYRFMLFDSTGEFKDEIDFSDVVAEEEVAK